MQDLTATVDPIQKDQAWLHQSPADIPQRQRRRALDAPERSRLIDIQFAAIYLKNWRVLKFD